MKGTHSKVQENSGNMGTCMHKSFMSTEAREDSLVKGDDRPSRLHNITFLCFNKDIQCFRDAR